MSKKNSKVKRAKASSLTADTASHLVGQAAAVVTQRVLDYLHEAQQAIRAGHDPLMATEGVAHRLIAYLRGQGMDIEVVDARQPTRAPSAAN